MAAKKRARKEHQVNFGNRDPRPFLATQGDGRFREEDGWEEVHNQSQYQRCGGGRRVIRDSLKGE